MNVPAAHPRPIRIGLLTGSPIPYKVPAYRILEADPEIDFTVVYASSGGLRAGDAGYGRAVSWDTDLMSGYRSVFLERADSTPILGTRTWSVRDPDIIRVLRRERFDVLWLDGYNSLTYLYAILTQRAIGGATVFREEQTLIHDRKRWVSAVKSAVLRGLLHRQHALYISTQNRRWFERYGVARDRLHFAPYTADSATLDRASLELDGRREALLQRFGLDPDAGPVILSVSRLAESKQPLHLLEAFRRTRAERPCQLLVVGSGPLESAMHDAVRRESIPDVTFAGFLNQTEVTNAYACADVFALLSGQNETFGVAVAEAMHFGLPVVLSDKVGCAADLVTDNGFTVPSDDAAATAAAFGTIVDDADLRARMSDASRRTIGSWTPETTADGVRSAARAVLAERSPA